MFEVSPLISLPSNYFMFAPELDILPLSRVRGAFSSNDLIALTLDRLYTYYTYRYILVIHSDCIIPEE